MQVKLAEKRGFCFGVERAIELAEQLLGSRIEGGVYVLGPIIHNQQVVERLGQAGLKQVSSLDQIPVGGTVLIRSHGVGPELLEQAERRGLKVVDASCVLVKRAQSTVRQLHEEGYRVVMIGDRDHPEVRGVIGYAPDVIVVEREADVAAALPKNAKLGVVAQTTHGPEHVANMIAAICSQPFREIKIVNTLCPEVTRRQQAALELCRHVDVMFVLGGMHSANTRQLAQLCRQTGVNTYHLEGWQQFQPHMVSGKMVAGVTAGASTPESVVQEFAGTLEAVDPADVAGS